MSRADLPQMMQCGECDTLFLQFSRIALAGKIYLVCPNPRCHGPQQRCTPIQNEAIWWLFTHILSHSGMGETRRMHLRCIAESQMGPWQDSYRYR